MTEDQHEKDSRGETAEVGNGDEQSADLTSPDTEIPLDLLPPLDTTLNFVSTNSEEFQSRS